MARSEQVSLLLLLLLFNFVMHCCISIFVVAFEINYLVLSYLILDVRNDVPLPLCSRVCHGFVDYAVFNQSAAVPSVNASPRQRHVSVYV